MTRSSLVIGLALGVLAALAGFGCGSSSGGSGGTAGSGGSGGAGGSGGSGAPTFTEVYTNVMEPHGCTTHHAPGGDSFLDMSSQATAYKNLVNVKADGPACGKSGLTRVVPKSATESLFYEKVSEAKPPCGDQMPYGCPTGFSCLDASDQQTIAAWINAGALND